MDLYDWSMAYRGLTLNGHRSAAGALVLANEKDTIRVDRLDYSRLQQRDQREPLHLLTGGDLGDATLAFRYLSLAGTIKASSGPKLSDRIEEFLQAFHVEEAQIDSPSTEGVSPFTFTDVTEVDTTRGTALTAPEVGFYVPQRFLARPAAFPIITQRRSGGDAVGFAAELVCPDPRLYIDTAESVVLNSGNGFSAACPNWTTLQGIRVSPVVTIVTSANGLTNFTLANAADAVPSLVLDLSAVGAVTITFDAATGVILVGATERADLRTSGVTSLYPFINRGGATFAATNTTNVTSVTLAYRQARA